MRSINMEISVWGNYSGENSNIVASNDNILPHVPLLGLEGIIYGVQ